MGVPAAPHSFIKIPQGHEDSEYVLSFEIGQQESGFYSERTESQSHPVPYQYIDIYVTFTHGSKSGGMAICHVIQHKRFILSLAHASAFEHTTPLLSTIELLKLEDIYKYYSSICTYKNRMKDEFIDVLQGLCTRNQNIVDSSFNRLALCQPSITFSGPNVWNQLPLSCICWSIMFSTD